MYLICPTVFDTQCKTIVLNVQYSTIVIDIQCVTTVS